MINSKQKVIRCNTCDKSSVVRESYGRCPHCNSEDIKVENLIVNKPLEGKDYVSK